MAAAAWSPSSPAPRWRASRGWSSRPASATSPMRVTAPVACCWPYACRPTAGSAAAADLASPERIDEIAARITAADVPAEFAWLIEGPVDSLDGADFDVARDSDADLAVLQRLADLARRIGARAVNIHVISPSPDTVRLSLECRASLLDRALPFLARFVDLMLAAGAVPTVENMPPVLRMRRSDFAFTPIGMAADDLRWLVERLPGLRVLADTSHAGLYLNARRLPPDPAYAWSVPLASYLRQLPDEAAGQADLPDEGASPSH